MDDRTAEILTASKAIVEAVECETLPLSRIGLMARRLAHLVDDDTAFVWLSYEVNGFHDHPKPDRATKNTEAALRGYQKALRSRAATDFNRITPAEVAERIRRGEKLEKSMAYGAPLADLEAYTPPSEQERFRLGRTHSGLDTLAKMDLFDRERRAMLHRIGIAIHEWATGVYIAHRFREVAGNVFDRFKTEADVVLAEVCPDAIAKLMHAIERAGTDSPEAWAAATMSCRRVLNAFADAVYPPREELVNGRKVGKAEYKNRLWAFAKERGSKAREKQFLATEEIDGLCQTLDRVYELDSKGVHAEVTKQEAHLAVLRTYILLSQLARIVEAP